MKAPVRPSEALLAQAPEPVREYIAELEARLRQDSSTSSRPPSSDPPKSQAQRRAQPPAPRADGEPRRQGGQPGHPGHHRLLVSEARVDRLEVVRPEACRGCGAGLDLEAGPRDPADERVQVVELPPVRAEVTEYRLAARRCGSCGTITRAARPAEAGGGAFGPRLQAVATLLVGRYRLSRREAVACLAELGEVELSVVSRKVSEHEDVTRFGRGYAARTYTGANDSATTRCTPGLYTCAYRSDLMARTF